MNVFSPVTVTFWDTGNCYLELQHDTCALFMIFPHSQPSKLVDEHITWTAEKGDAWRQKILKVHMYSYSEIF